MGHAGGRIVNDPQSWLHLRIDEERLSRRTEAALEPDLPIVDAHHHLWDGSVHRYLLDEFLDDVQTGHNVLATVFVECSAMYRARGPEALRSAGETEFVSGIAAVAASEIYGATRVAAGIVAFTDLRGERCAESLERHAAAGGGRLRGIRHPVAWDADPSFRHKRCDPSPNLLADASFRRGFGELARRGLSFDAWVYHPQLDELTDLARAFPDTVIILNHVGGLIRLGGYASQRDEAFDRWRDGLSRLAQCPNVRAKIGGLGMRLFGFQQGTDAEAPLSAELADRWRPLVETTIELFGADRCMFESNFPMDKELCSYPVLWNAFKRITARYSDDERQALFAGTARAAYRLP